MRDRIMLPLRGGLSRRRLYSPPRAINDFKTRTVEDAQNSSKLAEMFARASSVSALVGMAVDVVDLFMALFSFVASTLRSYRLKASNAAPLFLNIRWTFRERLKK
jgi:hypothetical protein